MRRPSSNRYHLPRPIRFLCALQATCMGFWLGSEGSDLVRAAWGDY